MLSKNILDVTSQFIKNDIGVEIQETTTLPKIELMKYHSTIKLKLHNEIMSVISLEDSVLEKLLSIFAIDSIEDVTNEMLNEVLNESLNTIIGLSIHHFPDKYRKYELSTTLMVDKQILTQFDAIHTSYNYQVRTNVGNINISTIFIENK